MGFGEELGIGKVEGHCGDDSVIDPRIAPPEIHRSTTPLVVRTAPSGKAPLRGIIEAGSPFVVFGSVEGAGCDRWGAVAAGGFACLDATARTIDAPAPLPLHGDLPYLYARHGAPIYASVETWVSGAKATGRLDPAVTYHFVDRVPTARGDVVLRTDGSVVPAEQLSFYTPSAFVGRDLGVDPLPEGHRLGWCVSTKGCATADAGALAYHASFTVGPDEAPPGGTVRIWMSAPPPEEVGPDEVWLDADLSTQMIAVMRGEAPIYVTLMSAGRAGVHATPKGSRRLTDKLRANDMQNLPGSEDSYHVHQVPWVMHFRPRFALHGAFWHDRFGWPMSHGCLNLSAADARYIFAATQPAMPDGWRAIYATKTEPGSLVRVR